jgi:hypothetical protein
MMGNDPKDAPATMEKGKRPMTEEEKQDFEAQLEETDTKAVLLGIHAELQAIRSLLEATQSDTADSEDVATCDLCGETKPIDSLVEHAITEHKAPTDTSIEDVVRDE